MDYKINTDGASWGLIIPSGFVIRTQRVNIEPDPDNQGDYLFIVVAETYIDENSTERLLNDDIRNAETFPVTKNDLTSSTVAQLFVRHYKDKLKSTYGAANVANL